MASSALSSGVKYDANAVTNASSKPVIFFDNAQKHIDEMRWCPNVYAVKVPEISAMPPKISFEEPSFQAHLDHSGLSANFINFITWANGGNRNDHYDAISGLNEEHLHILENWLERTSNLRERWAIFDFDRTISKIEGFGSAADGMAGINRMYKAAYTDFGLSAPDDITAEEYMAYLCGGHRLSLLKQFMELCKANEVKIVILTNNGACTSDPSVFSDLLSVIGLNPGDFILLCSRPKPYSGNKGRALSQQLEIACGAAFSKGGNRRSHRNRRNRRRRTQRKTTK